MRIQALILYTSNKNLPLYFFIFKHKLGWFALQMAEKLVEAGQDKDSNN